MPYYAGHGARVAEFAETYIRQTKGRWAGEPLRFERWQQDWVEELLLVDEHGRFVYREALLGVARKNGKSTLSARADALRARRARRGRGRGVQRRRFARPGPRGVQPGTGLRREVAELRDWLTVHRDAIHCPSTDGVYRVLSSDGPLQHGLNPSAVFVDELWAHKNPELYYALTTGQLARLNPLVVSITTAGFDRDSIAWQVYQRGRDLAEDAMRRERFFFRWFEAPEGAAVDDPVAWAAANPSSWIDPDDLAREARRLPAPVFRRLHLNAWTDTLDAWVPAEAWDACTGVVRVDEAPERFIGVDVGLKRDSSAIVEVGWVDGKLHVRATVLTPRPGEPGRGGRRPRAGGRDELRAGARDRV